MVALLFIVVLVLLFPLFFPGYYITELLISFLPYLTAICMLFAVVSFVYLKKKMKPGYRSPAQRYFRGGAFLVFCILFFWYSKQFNYFYSSPMVQQEVQSWSLKILFANIHKDNTDYEGIKKTISDNTPDMLMFVEFADHHYQYLKDFLQKNYPYTNNVSRSKTFVWSMVFSKYPLTNKADDFPQWARRYGYFSLPYQWQQIYFYLMHTSSPDSYEHFVMRNEQLNTFVQDFENHESDRQHDNILVVGDFNITPRSPYYDILATSFSGKLDNSTKILPFLTTRRLKEMPIFQAHIDHVWASPTLDVQWLQTIKMPGSDHKAFLFEVWL